jgi:Ca-activated chloride channel family protein
MIDEFLHPERLVLLAAVVLFAAGYLGVLRWRRRATVRFTQVELLDAIAPARPGWRRHVVAVINLAVLAAGVVAIARPVTTSVERVVSEGRIMLLFDVSSSMAATDVTPTRFEAAQAAARQFIAQVEPDVEIGLISFSGDVAVETQPTLDRAVVTSAIDRLQLAPSTAIGDALVAGTDLLVDLAAEQAPAAGGDSDDPAADLSPGAIVLLTDGETTEGVPTELGAEAAAQANVPVFAISFGTPDGTITDPTTGDLIPVPVRPEPLQNAAEVTGGQAYEAASPAELADAYGQIREMLQETLGAEVEHQTENTWMWAGGAMALFALGWALSLWWLRGMV